VPALVSGGLTFVALSAGGTHSCGLTTGGLAYCWGENVRGQLGTGTTTNSSVPVRVSGQ
jgi:alpha-tubulin suppressor-like RCC1 family protein